jgi:lipopolysaccharide biosynthesis glycosyltransferase
MRTAIATFAFGAIHERSAEATHPTIRAHARRIGADFVRFQARRYPQELIMYEKLQCRDLLRGGYGRVIWLDSDVIVRSDTLDLFSVVRYGQLGAG